MKPTPPEIVRRSLLSVDHDATPAYRLLVRVGRHDLIFDAPPFAHYKQAMAHVATAVRAHAPRGHVQAVILQRRRPPNGHNGGPVHHADRPWIDVMSWDGDVTARILRQANHAAPDPPACTGSLPRDWPYRRPRRTTPRTRPHPFRAPATCSPVCPARARAGIAGIWRPQRSFSSRPGSASPCWSPTATPPGCSMASKPRPPLSSPSSPSTLRAPPAAATLRPPPRRPPTAVLTSARRPSPSRNAPRRLQTSPVSAPL